MTRTLWTAFALLAVACGAPVVNPATGGAAGGGGPGAIRPSAGGRFTLSGTVSGTGVHGSGALGGALVNALVQKDGSAYSYWYAHGQMQTDAAGRFQLTALPESATIQLQVWAEGYVQQCAAPPIKVVADARLNVDLVSMAVLSVSPDSVPPSAPGFRSISGKISEAFVTGTQSAAGAGVDFEPFIDFNAAFTVADDAGRFLLCGVPDGESVEICAGSGRRSACTSVPAGQSTGVEITLPES